MTCPDPDDTDYSDYYRELADERYEAGLAAYVEELERLGDDIDTRFRSAGGGH